MGSEAGPPVATALEAVAGLLDLRPARAGDNANRTRLGVVAGRSGPRYLVPVQHPRAAPAACLAYLGLRDGRTRITRGAVGVALRARLGRIVAGETLTADVGEGSLLAHLADVLGPNATTTPHEPGGGRGTPTPPIPLSSVRGGADPMALAVGVGLGRVDEVWKPTLQVFDVAGRPLAFVKIGLGPVADRLVASEADALRAWGAADDPRLVVPGLLAETSWRDIRLVVVAPLPDDARRLPPGAPSAWPVRTLDGPEQNVTPDDAGWWRHRAEGAEAHPRIRRLLERVGERHGATTQAWARWHGDWVPWNLARCGRGLIAWDWEYSEAGAPVGLDEVHGAYQVAHVVRGRSIHDALRTARAAAPSPWLADAHVAMLVTRSHELAVLAGREPSRHAELLAAADTALT